MLFRVDTCSDAAKKTVALYMINHEDRKKVNTIAGGGLQITMVSEVQPHEFCKLEAQNDNSQNVTTRSVDAGRGMFKILHNFRLTPGYGPYIQVGNRLLLW